MLRLIEYNYPLLFSRYEFVYDCVCVFCFVSVLCMCEFFSCGSYFWLHFLKREQKQTFPWYCLLTKTKLSFLYVFILFFRDLQITMVNFFFLLFAFLPQFLDALPYNSAFLSFAMKRFLSERESSTSSASSSFSSDSMQNKSHKQLLPTVDPARGGAPSNLYFSHDFTVEYICKIVLLHNHYNHNSLCMYVLIYS